MFTLYTSLPSEWFPRRNDEMIFYHMNLIFALNMFALGAWKPVSIVDEAWSYIVGWALMVFTMVSAISLMVIADRNYVSGVEVLFIRIPFSIYSGWLVAEVLLGTMVMLKSWGMSDPSFEMPP